MTLNDFRALALALPGVEEGPCYGTLGFRVKGKLLARAWDDGETLVLRVDLLEREALLQNDPDTFFLTDHYRPHAWVLVRLPCVDPKELAELLEDAWRSCAPKRLLEAFEADRGKLGHGCSDRPAK
jgi:hypothetical protein